jgi:hypothetical protein
MWALPPPTGSATTAVTPSRAPTTVSSGAGSWTSVATATISPDMGSLHDGTRPRRRPVEVAPLQGSA